MDEKVVMDLDEDEEFVLTFYRSLDLQKKQQFIQLLQSLHQLVGVDIEWYS